MPPIRLTAELAAEYVRLFETCRVRREREAEVASVWRRVAAARARYARLAFELDGGPPWYVIALLHQLEASGSWRSHLHNGDPLMTRTSHVPAGRPAEGEPPFTWEESAGDALRLRGLCGLPSWGLAETLYRLEGFNGWGYRRHHPETLSPYLWAGSEHYRAGKYVADGRWSATAVSRQIGAAVLLRFGWERGEVALG